MKRLNIVGKKFNRWTVLSEDEDYVSPCGKQTSRFICKCDCGTIKSVVGTTLTRGVSKSCGCIQTKKPSIIGQKYGMLTVVGYVGKSSARQGDMFSCLCDCGNEKIYPRSKLENGNVVSCGCKTYKHGQYKEKIYKVYHCMKQRCYNSNSKRYSLYGGRGISICNEWRGENGFMHFFEWAINNGYKQGLSIDRINNNGNYEPNNCRWVTQSVQSSNKRSNKRLTLNGETHTYEEWSTILHIPANTIGERVKKGWSTDKVLSKQRFGRGGNPIRGRGTDE